MTEVFGDAATVVSSTIAHLLARAKERNVDAAPDRGWDDAAWHDLEAHGWTSVGIAEEHGGAGGTLRDALAVTAGCAAAPVSVPLAETMILAPAIADMAQTAAGPMSGIVAVGLVHDLDTATRVLVPWAGVSDRLVLVGRTGDGGMVVEVETRAMDAEPWLSIADEPHARVSLAPTHRVWRAAVPIDHEDFAAIELTAALSRSTMMWAAMQRVADLTIEYVTTRRQFGAALAKQQAVKHLIARIVSEVEVAGAALQAAIEDEPRELDPFAVAAARIRVGQAAGVVSRLGHQLHGAMGFTREARLHNYTRRLWSWRDEYGTDGYWRRRLGDQVLAADSADVWSLMTQGAR